MTTTPDRLFAEPRLAELYDEMCAGRPDFAFYLPLVRNAGSVLDVGCGTGELLRLARDGGHTGRLTGLDPAAGMLGVARRARTDVEWVRGDLSTVGFAGEFDLVVMTGHAFQVLLTDDEVRGALAAMRAALAPGGRVVFETRNPEVEAWREWTAGRVSEARGSDGIVRCRAEGAAADGEFVSFSATYECDAWDAPEVSHSRLRFLSAEALDGFLDEAGLELLDRYGDWDASPYGPGSPEIISILGRRGA
ncbi:methyltransferase domain-containing protein [Streptomyces sp. A7024]|uniref:Methyltransferase domain-containing protein n=1 Tax=Streptomyces coryli TaxID=1128680 RepID=A0A6G4U4D4_9ACTN|nr:class I SAM-dependent methyltransferase [Streptomyces coryli]NGN67034.1 methyltransferase domain-containing protein [Streptomyces coryli]